MKGPRTEKGNRGIAKNRKDTKRREAIARQEKRDKRTDEQQLQELSYRPGDSLKERKRLEARIAKGGK